MNELVYKLSQFGFTVYESKAYLALLQKHPAIGYEVSKIAQIPTAKIYETLTGLKNKGVVYASATEPVTYYPLDPDVLLGRIHREFDEKMDDLSGLLSKVPSLPDIEFTWNLSGYGAVMEKMAAVVKNAQKDLLLSVWPEEAVILKEEIARAENRGVHVIAGVFGEFEPGCQNWVNLQGCGKTSQKRLGRRLNVVVGGAEEVVISETGGRDDTAGVWTTTPCIILTAKEYIKHDIWGNMLIRELGEERFEMLWKNSAVLSYLIQNR